MKKVYFSYAYTTPPDVAEAIKKKLEEIGVEVSFYTKGDTYTDVPIRECDAFVLLLPNDARKVRISTLSQGIQKELLLAYNLKKNILLVDDYSTLYTADIDRRDTTIERISGTNNNVVRELQQEPEEKKVYSDLNWLDTQNETDIIL